MVCVVSIQIGLWLILIINRAIPSPVEQKPIGLLNINGFFDATLQQLDKMVEEGYLKENSRNLLLVGTSVEDLMQKMNNYKAPEIVHVIHKVVN